LPSARLVSLPPHDAKIETINTSIAAAIRTDSLLLNNISLLLWLTFPKRRCPFSKAKTGFP
jgi:hypothetical protein